MILKIAWRNIWRNKRRTWITSASILFAVFFSVAVFSMNRGVFDNIVDSAVRMYVGYGQIHANGYWDDKTIDNVFVYSDSLQQYIDERKDILNALPRLESYALVSASDITRSAMIIGIDPELENQMTGIKDRIDGGGDYLESDDEAVIVSSGLAEKLHVRSGDTLIFLSQGYHGMNAVGKYPIKSLVTFGSPDLNQQVIYMPLALAQYFYGLDDQISSLVLQMPDKRSARVELENLKEYLDTDQLFEVMNWEELMPDIVSMRDLKESSNYITIFILYLIVAFGIFGTILMMTKEREYEFGVLVSIGMRRRTLAFSVWVETIILALIGTCIGLILSYALMYYLHVNPIVVSGEMAQTYEKFGIEPILPASIDLDIFTGQALIVIFMTSILALYPCRFIFKLKPSTAMRS